MREMNMHRHHLNLLIVLVVGVLLILGCGKTDEEKKRDADRREGPAKMAAARKDFSQKPAKSELVQQPYIKGKIVNLSSVNGGEFGYSDAGELRAITASVPEDVGTVILQECKSVQKGMYRTQDNPPREIPAMAMDCEVTIIDRSLASVIYVKRFQGKPTEEVRVGETQDKVTAGATQEINAFLASLPKK